jgi:hypothetical protein
MQGRLSESDLERAYDLIAEAIDRHGGGDEAAFLSRLALALAARMESVAKVEEAIAAAALM